MRCRECGMELDARDRLPNGAYQCPECGAINHTASSSRTSPSPWRRKRRSGIAAVADALTERRFGLPLWGWIAIALVAIIAIIVLANLGGGKPDAAADPNAGGEPAVESTASPDIPQDVPLDGADIADGADSPEPEGTQVPLSNSTLSTGVALNDFTVGFDWAMNALKYSDSLTLLSSGTGMNGETVNSYSFQDWYTLQLVLAPNSETIRSATATVQLEEGSPDNLRALGGLAATVYSFDNSISGGAARRQIQTMIDDNSKFYDRQNFTGKLESTSDEYTMTITGKL